jgi:sigma-E factor negative regulatory protein RseC
MIFIISNRVFLTYSKTMKPTVPETGTVLSLKQGNAVIRLRGGKSCKGCGMAAIGLCRAGDTSMLLNARNNINAKVGDTVLVGLDQETKRKGFFMAYFIPVFALMAGALAGSMLGEQLSMPHLDALGGFTILALASFFSFRKLRELDNTKSMVVTRIIEDEVFTGEVKSEEERWYLS